MKTDFPKTLYLPFEFARSVPWEWHWKAMRWATESRVYRKPRVYWRPRWFVHIRQDGAFTISFELSGEKWIEELRPFPIFDSLDLAMSWVEYTDDNAFRKYGCTLKYSHGLLLKNCDYEPENAPA